MFSHRCESLSARLDETLYVVKLFVDFVSTWVLFKHSGNVFFSPGVGMAGTGEGKKEEADYKRLHSFPLIRVGQKRDSASWYRTRTSWLLLGAACSAVTASRSHFDCCLVQCRLQILGCWVLVFIVKMCLFHGDMKCTCKNKCRLSKIAFWKWQTTSQLAKLLLCVLTRPLKHIQVH